MKFINSLLEGTHDLFLTGLGNFSILPVYSGKQIVKGDLVIFSANRSFLLRKRIIDVSVNHLLLQMESNSFMLSIIRFCKKKTTKFNEENQMVIILLCNAASKPTHTA